MNEQERQAASRAMAEGQDRPCRWTDVHLQRPVNRSLVVVKLVSGKKRMGNWSSEMSSLNDRPELADDITHWMEIPA